MTNPTPVPDAWGTWLRRYQLGDWNPKAVLDPPSQISCIARDGLTPTATSIAATSSADSEPHSVLLDPNLSLDSKAFFEQNGWLAAPPLRQQHRRLVLEALFRHRSPATKALNLHVKHAKAVFKCKYASVIIQTFDESELLILAQDGGDPLVERVPQTVSLCSHAMLLPDDEVLVINNARDDWRFASCPATLAGSAASATGKSMNFYASAPLILSYNLSGVEGTVQVGRLCIMDEQPRDAFDDEDAQLLSSIAKMAADLLERDFQSARNAKTAAMQRRVGTLIRLVDSVAPSGSDQQPAKLSASTHGYRHFSPAMVERGCDDVRHCLGAAAVAVFDLSQFRLRPQPVGSASQPDSPTASPKFARGDSSHQPRLSHLSKGAAPHADPVLQAIDARPASLPPSVLSFSGDQHCRPRLPTSAEGLKSVFAAPLARSATETNMNTRCRFYRRQPGSAGRFEEVIDDTFSPTLDHAANPYADLLPSDGRVTSYAVCTSYHPTKSRGGIMFLIMFTDPVSFEQQERYYVETTTQIAFGSLIRQERSSVESLQADFLRHVQHNLRTPLHGALGAVDYLRAAINIEDAEDDSAKLDLSTNGVLATLLESISLSGLTLNSYIDDLLSFQNLLDAKQGSTPSAKPTRADVVKLVESVADEESEYSQRLKLQAPALSLTNTPDDTVDAVQLIIQASPQVRDCEWLVNAKALQHIVRKLISNALRFTSQGYVEITVGLAASPAADASSKAPLNLEIVVTDTGLGMTEAFCQDQLSLPFSKADPFQDGIGLGMAIVSSELEKCGGSFTVTSEVNVGTRVVVNFPIERASQPEHPPTLPSSTLSATKTMAVSKVAFLGFETHGLRRLAASIGDHLSSLGGVQLTQLCSQADCIILPERQTAMLDQAPEPLLAYLKPDARFVVLRSSHLIKSTGLEILDGRAVLLLPTPHGPSSLQLLDLFLADSEPLQIRTVEPIPSRNLQHRPSIVDVEIFKSAQSLATVPDILDETANVDLNPDTSVVDPHNQGTGSFTLNPAWTGMAIEPVHNEFRVLVVEDNPINMKLLTTLCKRLKIKYQEACDGAEAVAKFESFRPSVVLLDISLPVQDGFEACTQMRALNHPSFIVAVTALGSEEDKARGLDLCRMDAWMTKPVSMRQLKGDLEFWKSSFEQQKVLTLRRTSF